MRTYEFFDACAKNDFRPHDIYYYKLTLPSTLTYNGLEGKPSNKGDILMNNTCNCEMQPIARSAFNAQSVSANAQPVMLVEPVQRWQPVEVLEPVSFNGQINGARSAVQPVAQPFIPVESRVQPFIPVESRVQTFGQVECGRNSFLCSQSFTGRRLEECCTARRTW